MPYDTAVFLVGPGHESRNIYQAYQRNIEGIAKPYKASCLLRSLNIQHPCKNSRLIGDCRLLYAENARLHASARPDYDGVNAIERFYMEILGALPDARLLILGNVHDELCREHLLAEIRPLVNP